jgi:hypothetical protein
MDKTTKNAEGDCFIRAAQIGLGFEPDVHLDEIVLENDDDVKIVHGLPIGRGESNAGRRYWHAWVEVTMRTPIPEVPELEQLREAFGRVITSTFVLDRSQGQDTFLPQAVYYSVGQLDEDHVWRFSIDEAREMMARDYQHYGPWVEGWESMEEV